MVATTVTEFVILQLIYLPLRKTEDKIKVLDRRRIRPSGSAAHIRPWYNVTMRKERARVRPGTRMLQIQSRIFSGNTEMFEIDGCVFDMIYLILGEYSYWVFFKRDPEHRTVEGSGLLSCAYCACCILSQYQLVLNAIKTHKRTPQNIPTYE